MEPREGDSDCAEGAFSVDYCYYKVEATDIFYGKEQTKCDEVKGSAHIRRRWENILANMYINQQDA